MRIVSFHLHLVPLSVLTATGADFREQLVATAPSEMGLVSAERPEELAPTISSTLFLN